MLFDRPLTELDVFSHDFHYNSGIRKKEKRRFRFRKELIIFWDQSYGTVQDISLGGLSFLSPIIRDENPGTEMTNGKKDWIELLFGQENIRISNLLSEIIYNDNILFSERGDYQSYYCKRCGLSFTGLPKRQLFMIKSIIFKGCLYVNQASPSL